MKRALILVDIQNDFLPGGALAVPDGDHVIEVANRLMNSFELVVATQDWHPSDHGSFASQHPDSNVGDLIELNGLPQMLWPDHCIQNGDGAKFAASLNRRDDVHIFPKGTDKTIDSYSGFFDNGHRKATGLGEFLKAESVQRVFVLGLATDYCVKFTALDAKELGFETFLVEDGCRGVNLQPTDVADAIAEMKSIGVRTINSSDVSKEA